MNYQLHKSKEGFIITSDELPKDQEGYWTYIGFNEPIIVTKCNVPNGWFGKLHDKNNYKTVIAQEPNIIFSALKEEEQKTIGWFDAKPDMIPFPDSKEARDGKEIKTWMNGWEEGHIEGFRKAQKLLSNRNYLTDIEIQLLIDYGFNQNTKNGYIDLKEQQQLIQSIHQKSWNVELKIKDDGKVKILKLL